ncbi:MAG: glycosyltransferase family 2 protein, partial [Candidatus Acidiferrales bacterium]
TPMSARVPISVLIPARNEARNLRRCLDPLVDWADQIVVADSGSSDGTVAIAESYGATVVQFTYQGGWPKKRQAILDSFPFRNEWILLLDADEILLGPIRQEIGDAIRSSDREGFWLRFQIHFLGRQLRFGDTQLWKLCLFRKGAGRYERRLTTQDASMSDIEVHEHVVVSGRIGRLTNPVRHENWNALDRYIEKHNEYSNWEAKVHCGRLDGEIKPTPWGCQAARRRWLKRTLLSVPGSPILLFVQKYFLKLGLLDGIPGLTYCGLQAVQLFHVKAKMYEIRRSGGTAITDGADAAAPSSGIDVLR